MRRTNSLKNAWIRSPPGHRRAVEPPLIAVTDRIGATTGALRRRGGYDASTHRSLQDGSPRRRPTESKRTQPVRHGKFEGACTGHGDQRERTPSAHNTGGFTGAHCHVRKNRGDASPRPENGGRSSSGPAYAVPIAELKLPQTAEGTVNLVHRTSRCDNRFFEMLQRVAPTGDGCSEK